MNVLYYNTALNFLQSHPVPSGSDWRIATEADIRRATAPTQFEAYRKAAQDHLDKLAQAHGYDSIASAVTYAEEPAVPKFQAEGQAFRAWRSLVWAFGYEQLALVEAGERPAPTIAEFIAELPPLDLPAPSTAGQE